MLVANAGVGHAAPVLETTEEQLREQVEVNLLGVIRSAQAVLPAMRTQGSGHILAVASVAAGCAMSFSRRRRGRRGPGCDARGADPCGCRRRGSS